MYKVYRMYSCTLYKTMYKWTYNCTLKCTTICTRPMSMKPQVTQLNKLKKAMYKTCHALRI